MAGVPYSVSLVNVLARAQDDPAYRRLSPFGKVPAMLVDGEPLLENSGIIALIAALRPDAGIFPSHPTPRMVGDAMSGISFCIGHLHPLVRGLAHPDRITLGDVSGAREKSRALLSQSFDHAERRLEERGWWLGAPSIVDVYLDWIAFVAVYGGFDMAPYPCLAGLSKALEVLPAYRRMLALDETYWSELAGQR